MAGFRNHIWYELLDEEGVPVSGASIWLYEFKKPTTQLRVFDVNDDTLSQPLTTNVQGIFDFFVRDNIYSRSTGYTWDTQFIISWSKDDKSGIIRGDHLFGEYESASTSGNLSRLNKAISNNLGWIYNTHVDAKFGLLTRCGSSSSSSSSQSSSSSSSSSYSSSSSSSSQSSSSSSSSSESVGPEIQEYVVYSEAGDGMVDDIDASWATARNNTVGDEAFPVIANIINAFSAVDFGSTYFIARSFFGFDLSEIPSAGRTFESAALDIGGDGNDEGNVMVQESTFSGTVVVADYDQFTGGPFLSAGYNWEQFDLGGGVKRNKMFFNSAGNQYVKNRMGNSSLKFCVREYDHDYLDVEPSGLSFKNGCYYIEEGANITTGRIRTPRLIVRYSKLPSWSQHLDNSDWSATNGSTWDGSKWNSSSGSVELQVAGAWATGYKPYKIRISFSGTSEVWLEMYNTEGSHNLFDNREIQPNGKVLIVNGTIDFCNYNNLDIDLLWIFNREAGEFSVTNIEFLDP